MLDCAISVSIEAGCERKKGSIMTPLLCAVVLGVIQGLTEFIPVSSTGHLILAGNALGFSGPKADAFDIFIQLGSILAVVALYFGRFTALLDFRSRPKGGGFRGAAGLAKLGLACFPIMAVGYLLHDRIEAALFAPVPVAAALCFGGGVMLLLESHRFRRAPIGFDQITPLQCLLIGLFQCLALWPGMSRSGSTIIGAMLTGVDRRAAAEFSFFIAVPVMTAATLFKLMKSLSFLNRDDLAVFAAGFAVTFVVSILAIRFFMGLLARVTLRPFGWYRIALGALILWWIK